MTNKITAPDTLATCRHQAGVDALAGDSFGRLAMSREGLNKRNNMVRLAA